MTRERLLELANIYRLQASHERGEKHRSIYLVQWFELQAVLCEREANKIVD